VELASLAGLPAQGSPASWHGVDHVLHAGREQPGAARKGCVMSWHTDKVLPNMAKRQEEIKDNRDPDKTQRVKHQDIIDEFFDDRKGQK
jgi:hypothetical protein